MKVAIYGGAFDPPHIGHLHVLSLLKRSGRFDEIWVVPTGTRADKNQIASGPDRVALCERLVSSIDGVEVCDLQVSDPEAPTTTLLFARYLREKFLDASFSFVIGSELIPQLSSWHESEALKREVAFIVVPRPGEAIASHSDFNLQSIDLEGFNLAFRLSSSDIRRMLSDGFDVQAYVPALVLQFIRQHGLYGTIAGNPVLTVFRGKFMEACIENDWEYVDRIGCSSTVGIIAIHEDKLILVDQYRPPRKAKIIELPAGLVGDREFNQDTIESAAKRELLEETGFLAQSFETLGAGPTTAGLSSEFTHILWAKGLKRQGPGGGDASEEITVHEVPLASLSNWLEAQVSKGFEIDLKVYTALYFCLWLQGKTPVL